MLNLIYWIAAAAALGVLALEAPHGALLTSAPERGKIARSSAPPGSAGSSTVRGGPMFIWLGGGYHGGK